MASLCITAMASGSAERRSSLLNLARALGGVDLVLYGDGVYNLVNDSQAAKELVDAPVKLYALADDVANRGLSDRVIPQAELVDYARVVELIVTSDRTITNI